MPVRIHWFRRDLRLFDNAALYQALSGDELVVPIFIFDTEILNQLEDKNDRRVAFIHRALEDMQLQLIKIGSSLEVYNGNPLDVFQQLIKKYSISAVFTNHLPTHKMQCCAFHTFNYWSRRALLHSSNRS